MDGNSSSAFSMSMSTCGVGDGAACAAVEDDAPVGAISDPVDCSTMLVASDDAVGVSSSILDGSGRALLISSLGGGCDIELLLSRENRATLGLYNPSVVAGLQLLW
jgi:hypothetical protein